MIEFDCETTGLQPWSGNNEAFLWIFWDGEDPETAEAIPFMPSGVPLASWDIAAASRVRANAHLTTLANAAISDAEDGGDVWTANRARVQAWFDRAKLEGIRAWNAKFDRAFADAPGIFDIPGDGLWHDGMLVAHAIDERRSVALKAVASTLFGEEVADPQKAVKKWLNDENKRRRKIENDAKKAVNGTLKIKEAEEVTCTNCGDLALVECEECQGLGYTLKERRRKATEDECAAVIAEAKMYRRDDDTFNYANFSDVPREIMEPYALDDVYLTRRVCDAYQVTLGNTPDLKRVVEFERQAMDALYAIEKRGLPARTEEYRKLEQEVTDNLTALEDRVHELAHEGDPVVYAKAMAGKDWGEGKQWVVHDAAGQVTSYEGGAAVLDEFNPNSTPQILAALKARGADMSYMSEKDGSLSADAENLRAVDDALAAAILDFRSEYKVLSTYVRPMLGRTYVSSMNTYKEPFVSPVDSRIHATYRQVGARTGRMSCADPNMQNQPRDDLRLRYNIVAEPGHVLVTADLTNIEMYLFAAYCGEGRLLDAVKKGDDLHELTAKMLGLRDRKRPGGGVETARQLGKTYNFSRIYGGGLRTIKRSFRCTMDEARLLKRRFDEAYPEVARLQNRIEYRLQDDGYIQDKLISGRRFRVDPRDAYKATNYLVQGTAASLLKYATIQLHRDGVPMVALVHDEVVAHVPKEDAVEVADLIVERLTEFEGLKGVVPLKAEADIVGRWSDAKPLQEKNATGEKIGAPYLFTPKWAGGERRPIPTVKEVLAAA
jgi:DNA polymerase I-like protein with 3'-5' exonuclease and polymerase domains